MWGLLSPAQGPFPWGLHWVGLKQPLFEPQLCRMLRAHCQGWNATHSASEPVPGLHVRDGQ